MIAAHCRISRNTDKILINYPFKYINNAKNWCIENIGKNVDDVGIIEYISLTGKLNGRTRRMYERYTILNKKPK